MLFEWDETKNKINKEKHKISFETALLIFNDPYLISTLDERYDYEDERWISIGSAAGAVLLFVVNTILEDENGEEIIRIISARKAKEGERERYLQAHT